MRTITEREATRDLRGVMAQAAELHEPVQITGEADSAVLVSEQDWRSIEETLFLLSIPSMRESIREGLDTPVSDCSPDLPW